MYAFHSEFDFRLLTFEIRLSSNAIIQKPFDLKKSLTEKSGRPFLVY
jgi:hypothetical protein